MKTMTDYIIRHDVNRTRLSTILMILMLYCGAWQLYAQEWTEPVNVSNSSGFIYYPDMVIDRNGIIHVVWCQVFATNFSKLFYSFSTDDGETWSQPTDILSNTSIRMGNPHIAIGRSNNIHVSYDFGVGSANKCVYFVYFDGSQWSEPFNVSEGMGASDYNKIVIDDYDRVFIFWAYGSFYMLYRYFENGYWSNYYCPYCDSLDMFAFSDSHELLGNQLFWVGASMSSSYYGERPQYYEFYVKENFWREQEMISTDTIIVDIAMKMNNENIPNVTYRKRTTSPQSGTDLTALIKKEGSNWNTPEIVAHETGMQSYQRIAIDQNNDIHIVENIYKSNDSKLVHYHLSDEIWINYVIDQSANFCHPSKLLFFNKKLYLIYFKSNIGGYQSDGDIFFTKYDILTHIPEAKHKPAALQVFPNPARHSVTIAFELEQQQHITVAVFDIAGKPIKQIANQSLPSGAHSFVWNGTDHSGRQVNSGTYLVQLQTQQGSATQTVEIAR